MQLASSQLSRHIGQQWFGCIAMFSTCYGGLRRAGDDELLPLTAAAAVAVMLEREERPQLCAGLGRGGRNAQISQEGNAPKSPGSDAAS